MALALARSLIAEGRFDEEAVAQAYVEWFLSRPFDIGGTTRAAISPAAVAQKSGRSAAQTARRAAKLDSQANGCLMRISTLGIFGSGFPSADVWQWACADASLTHPHPVCVHCTALFAAAIAFAINSGEGAEAKRAHTFTEGIPGGEAG